MRRFRNLRRRTAAAALLPVAAFMISTNSSNAAEATASKSERFDASKSRVAHGQKVKLSGKFSSPPQTVSGDAAGEDTLNQRPARREVRIEFRPAGSDNWRKAKTTKTSRDGKYAERVRVKKSGRFRAVAPDGATTRPELVRVKAKLKARVKGAGDTQVGDKVKIKGQVVPRGSQRQVAVKVGNDRIKTKTRKNGTFAVKWKAPSTGNYKVRAKAKGDKLADGDKTKAGKVTVFRPANASWYGPGFYGNRTACGQTLTTSTRGVAHKTMPCGTKLTLRYKGNETVVRVIDRGPYHGNREFDLTGATKNDLGFGSTGVVYSSR